MTRVAVVVMTTWSKGNGGKQIYEESKWGVLCSGHLSVLALLALELTGVKPQLSHEMVTRDLSC